jgi:hypothetical protein
MSAASPPSKPTGAAFLLAQLGSHAAQRFSERVGKIDLIPVLHKAFDQLVGPGRWLARESLGSFPIRFPSPADPGDTGWYIDVSFGLDKPNFMEWRANITSRGRALLMLFLFSDVR